MNKINSVWTVETGRWSDRKCKFVDRKSKTFERELEMEIAQGQSGPVIKFIGGPTGFESYYIKDLLEDQSKSGPFWICAGTINRWPRCSVEFSEVIKFIKESIKC